MSDEEAKREKENVRMKERRETRKEKGNREKEGDERRKGSKEYRERKEKRRRKRKDREDLFDLVVWVREERRSLDGVGVGVEDEGVYGMRGYCLEVAGVKKEGVVARCGTDRR